MCRMRLGKTLHRWISATSLHFLRTVSISLAQSSARFQGTGLLPGEAYAPLNSETSIYSPYLTEPVHVGAATGLFTSMFFLWASNHAVGSVSIPFSLSFVALRTHQVLVGHRSGSAPIEADEGTSE